MTLVDTARLRLRRFTLDDVAPIFAMSQEPLLRRWLPDQVYRDAAHAEQVLRALIELAAPPPDPRTRAFVLGVEDRASGALIGHVGLSPARGTVEVGYAIAAQRHGQGLATEAVHAMTSWALAELAVAEVLGIVGEDNVASRRVLEKAGFVRIGVEARPTGAIVLYRRA